MLLEDVQNALQPIAGNIAQLVERCGPDEAASVLAVLIDEALLHYADDEEGERLPS